MVIYAHFVVMLDGNVAGTDLENVQVQLLKIKKYVP